jgi:hypothetical protein
MIPTSLGRTMLLRTAGGQIHSMTGRAPAAPVEERLEHPRSLSPISWPASIPPRSLARPLVVSLPQQDAPTGVHLRRHGLLARTRGKSDKLSPDA